MAFKKSLNIARTSAGLMAPVVLSSMVASAWASNSTMLLRVILCSESRAKARREPAQRGDCYTVGRLTDGAEGVGRPLVAGDNVASVLCGGHVGQVGRTEDGEAVRKPLVGDHRGRHAIPRSGRTGQGCTNSARPGNDRCGEVGRQFADTLLIHTVGLDPHGSLIPDEVLTRHLDVRGNIHLRLVGGSLLNENADDRHDQAIWM